MHEGVTLRQVGEGTKSPSFWVHQGSEPRGPRDHRGVRALVVAERGLQEWVEAFEAAREQSRYALCEALRSVGAKFQPEDPWWQALMAKEEGQYLFVRSRYVEADKALQASVAAYDEALRESPDEPNVVNFKGNALSSRGELLAGLSRNEEAQEAYGDAVAAYDEALKRFPDDIDVNIHKAVTLFQWGESMQPFVQSEVTRSRWEAAQAHCEHILALSPHHEMAEELLAYIREQLDNLEARSSSEG